MLPIIEFKTHPAYNEFCTTFTDEQKIYMVREYRDMLLVQSDFSQLADAPVDKEAWAEYRQQLRNYMSTYDVSNLDPTFPQKPQEGTMNNQIDFNKVIENLSTQIAMQAQQIAILQTVLQQLVPAEEAANTDVVENIETPE